MLRACFSIVNNNALIEDTGNAAREITNRSLDAFNQRFFDSATVKQLLSLFNRCNTTELEFTKSNLIRIFGHMCSTVNCIEGMQTFIQANGLEMFQQLLLGNDQSHAVDSLWALSNLACENEFFALKLAQSDIFNTIVDKMENSNVLSIKKECYITIGNLLSTLSVENLEELLNHYDKLLESYFKGGEMISERSVIINILCTVEALADHDDRYNRTGPQSFKGRLETSGGLDVLEELQKVPNEDIYKSTVALLTKYFDIENEMEQISTSEPPQGRP